MNNWNLGFKKSSGAKFTYEVTMTVESDCDEEDVIAGIVHYTDYLANKSSWPWAKDKINNFEIVDTGCKLLSMEPDFED